MSKYIHKPDGIDAMLALAGLVAKWVPVSYNRGARLMGTGCWHVRYADNWLSITAHMTGDESFESWVAIIQNMCRKREEMKESRS